MSAVQAAHVVIVVIATTIGRVSARVAFTHWRPHGRGLSAPHRAFSLSRWLGAHAGAPGPHCLQGAAPHQGRPLSWSPSRCSSSRSWPAGQVSPTSRCRSSATPPAGLDRRAHRLAFVHLRDRGSSCAGVDRASAAGHALDSDRRCASRTSRFAGSSSAQASPRGHRSAWSPALALRMLEHAHLAASTWRSEPRASWTASRRPDGSLLTSRAPAPWPTRPRRRHHQGGANDGLSLGPAGSGARKTEPRSLCLVLVTEIYDHP